MPVAELQGAAYSPSFSLPAESPFTLPSRNP